MCADCKDSLPGPRQGHPQEGRVVWRSQEGLAVGDRERALILAPGAIRSALQFRAVFEKFLVWSPLWIWGFQAVPGFGFSLFWSKKQGRLPDPTPRPYS